MNKLNGLVVVGSVALDTVETVHGRNDDALGGAAVYFSLASRFFSAPIVIGVVGDDFPDRHIDMLKRNGVGVECIRRAPGSSFRWSGRYSPDGNTATSLDTQLGVFAQFQPEVAPCDRTCGVLFVANIDPDLQLHVLKQMPAALKGGDTMNFWIDGKRAALGRMLSRLHILFVNDQEARSLTGEHSVVKAGRALLKLGPAVAVVKKGEHGSMICSKDGILFCPPYPVDKVVDPTGAGDSFAGAFMGYLASRGLGSRAPGPADLAAACAYGSVVSSFTVASFGVNGLLTLRNRDIRKRLGELRRLVRMPSL